MGCKPAVTLPFASSKGGLHGLRPVFLLLLVCCVIGAALPLRAEVVASDSFDYSYGTFGGAHGGVGWSSKRGWLSVSDNLCYVCDSHHAYVMHNEQPLAAGRVAAFHGSQRNAVPLRRELKTPFTGNSLFVRFVLRYDAKTIDDVASQGDGEFFVLWLDDIDSADGAGHTPNAPSIGVRIPDPSSDRATPGNRFMIRMKRNNPSYSEREFIGDETYLVVAKLSKSSDHPLAPFDRMELWIDPDKSASLPKPDASSEGRSINSVRWVGFSIGRRTEPQDFITVDELVLGETWSDVLPDKEFSQSEITSRARPGEAASRVDFGRQVLPILQNNCFDCHQGQDALSGQRLDVYEELLGHSQGKPLIVPGNSNQSPLLQVLVTPDEDLRMPPDSDPLPDDEIAVLRDWIDQGAAWDKQKLPSEALESDHWAFQPIERPKLPSVPNQAEVQTGVDPFILSRLKEAGIAETTLADRQTLVRRMTLDLTGLPPSPEEVEEFLSDQSPEAVDRLIDRLLGSPAYAEHWARHWLDLARWGESDGYQHNQKRPHAWRYRDYVIRSLLNNKPYDEFVREQVAGDELKPSTDERLIATGFLASARYSSNERDEKIQRNDILVDITNNTATTFLGLTLQCAQCHNHKFDPVTARDYYRFMGYFVKGQPVEILLPGAAANEQNGAQQDVLDGISDQYQMIAESMSRMEASRRRQGLPTAVTSIGKAIKSIPPEDRERFDEVQDLVSGYDRAWSFYSPVTASATIGVPYLDRTSPLSYSLHKLQRATPVLLIRGDINSPGPQVDIGWPEVFGGEANLDEISETPRTSLANWMVGESNPLTARVWVNRIWAWHFGRGIVSTVDDFGTQGSAPSHPLLLDWLASELVESGWDTNHIHRLILKSRTYQLASTLQEPHNSIDPENTRYWRWSRRRLQAESIRDSILAVSGVLDRTLYGPSASMKVRGKSLRRTIYLEQKRGTLPTVQNQFDGPNALTCCGVRRTSTVALQPLYLLNDKLVLGYVKSLAQRVGEEAGSDPQQQIDRAFQLALSRRPSDDERETLIRFMDSIADEDSANSLLFLCHAVVNLNEFLYIP